MDEQVPLFENFARFKGSIKFKTGNIGIKFKPMRAAWKSELGLRCGEFFRLNAVHGGAENL
jgi:hypothetical protein